MEKHVNNNRLLQELLLKQLKTVRTDKKLQYSDIKRICKYINTSIFDENNCCLWNGYITNTNNPNKGTYINLYFKKKKVALHRLLYENFIDELYSDEYLKFTCNNKGRCCNIHHLQKLKYRKKVETNSVVKKKKSTKTVKIVNINSVNSKSTENLLHISFD